MKLSRQDNKILLALLGAEQPLTRYAIAKETGIHKTQVEFRLNKMMEFGVVRTDEGGKTTTYLLHPSLTNKSTVDLISKKVKDISDAIDKMELTTPEGMSMIIAFIIEHTDIKRPNGGA